MKTQHEQTPGLDSDLEIDLCTAQARDRTTGRVVAYLSPWKHRERVIGTEMFLATALNPGGLNLFEMAVRWPKWFRHATYFQDIRDMFNPARWAINKAFGPYHWQVDEVGRVNWAISPDPEAPVHAVIKADGAIVHLKAASEALAQRDYAAAMSGAIEALTYCGESLQARLLIGSCHFCYERPVDHEIATETAERVLEHEDNLRLACRTLPVFRRREASRSPHRWAFADEFIRRFEEQLEIYRDLFEKARAFLYGD
jgi:hypothetical protein